MKEIKKKYFLIGKQILINTYNFSIDLKKENILIKILFFEDNYSNLTKIIYIYIYCYLILKMIKFKILKEKFFKI